MDHVSRGKPEALRDLGFSGVAAAERGAGLAQLGPRGAVNGAVDAAAAKQAVIRGVDDGVDIERGDIALDDGDAVRHGALDARIGRGSRAALSRSSSAPGLTRRSSSPGASCLPPQGLLDALRA